MARVQLLEAVQLLRADFASPGKCTEHRMLSSFARGAWCPPHRTTSSKKQSDKRRLDLQIKEGRIRSHQATTPHISQPALQHLAYACNSPQKPSDLWRRHFCDVGVFDSQRPGASHAAGPWEDCQREVHSASICLRYGKAEKY